MDRQLDLSNVRIYSNTKQDIVDAIDLIGEEVYLADRADFGLHTKAKLTGVICAEDDDSPFFRGAGNQHQWGYKYLILAKDAKFKEEEKERILRPFKDIKEFRTVTGRGIGGVITYKKKDSDAEYTVLINGYVRVNDNILGIYLGRRSYTFKELKDDYLYLHADITSSEWKPFGMEE